MTAVYTDDPEQVQGCADCLELVAEDLQDHTAGRRSPPGAGCSGAGRPAGPVRPAEGPDGSTTQIVPIISLTHTIVSPTF